MSISTRVLSDAWFSALRTSISVLRGLVTIPLITKLLGAGSFGVWSTVFAFIGLMSGVGEMHLHGALTRYGGLDKDKEQTYIDILALGCILGLIFAIITLIFGFLFEVTELVGEQYIDPLYLIIISSLTIYSDIMFKININFPRAKRKVKHFEILQMIRTLTESIGLIIIFLLGGEIIHGMLVLLTISLVANCLLSLYILTTYTIPYPDHRNYPKYLKYGLPMVPASLSNKIHKDADKYLIIYFISPTAVGIYAVAYGVSGIFRNFTGLLNSSLYPRVAMGWEENKLGELQELYEDIFRYYIIIALPALVGLTILAESILTVLSTTEIAESGWILVPIISLGFLLRGFDNPVSYILTAAEETHKISIAVILSTLVNVLLNIGLIPIIGIIGAAFSTVISQSLATMLILYFSRGNLKFQFPFDTFIKASGSAFLMGLILLLMPINFGHITAIAVYVILGMIAYFVIMYFIGGITEREMKYARQIW